MADITIKQAAQSALDVQDAVNLSGVLRSFHELVVDVLWPEARRLGEGTDWVNSHAIVALFLWKLTDLNGSQEFSQAYAEVKRIAADGPVLR
jgi:hypothetical protein